MIGTNRRKVGGLREALDQSVLVFDDASVGLCLFLGSVVEQRQRGA